MLTGIQPTGAIHLGNWSGALHSIVKLQKKHTTFLVIADLHALTSDEVRDTGGELKKFRENIVLDLLGVGIDPKHTHIYFQSSLQETFYLQWILSNFVTVPTLELGHAYKTKKQSGKSPVAGLLMYPVLQAADILLMRADEVPVGVDQEQHLELTREIARRINSISGTEVLKVPKTIVLKSKEVTGIDGRKMSKSYTNTLPLFEKDNEVRAHISSIVTDSIPEGEPLDPETCTVFEYHTLVTPPCELENLEKEYREGTIGYKGAKELLVKNFLKWREPFLKRRMEYENNPEKVASLVEEGTRMAKKRAKETLLSLNKVFGLES